MALARVHESDEEEEYHSLSGHEPDGGEDDDSGLEDEPPVHPVSALQGAFEESIRESTEGDGAIKKSTANGNAEIRRRKLLESNQYDDSWTTRWKQQPGAQHHPLLKLMAQIVFGMHLLQQQQAKSDEEVVKILQTHVNEVDSFLERTSDDFDLAINDIEDRVRHLRLPMSHLETFNAMLDDKKFRTQLMEGNDRIDIIIERTTKAMNAALMDVQHGQRANQELGGYLDNVKNAWPLDKQDLVDVFGAMQGNERGWRKYLNDLQTKGESLGKHLTQLGVVTTEMSKLAAAASRRNRPQSRQFSPSRSAPASPALRSKFSNESVPPLPTRLPSISHVLNKPLPRDPDARVGTAQAAVPKMHAVPFAQRYESPRASPRSPPRRTPATSSPTRNGELQRPKTAGHAPRDARVSKSDTTELVDFLRHSGPLRSNPPEPGRFDPSQDKQPKRSQSQGAQEVLSLTKPGSETVDGVKDTLKSTQEQTPVEKSMQSQPTPNVLHRRSSSRPRTQGAEKALSVRSGKSTAEGRKDSGTTSGFARRISMRMKHLPASNTGPLASKPSLKEAVPQTQSNVPEVTTMPSPPADSAYASELEQPVPLRSLTGPISQADRPAAARSPTLTEKRPPSRFGLFPKSSGAPATSGASINSNGHGSFMSKSTRGKEFPAKTSSGSTPSGPIKTSRMGSVRNFLRGKR